MRALRDRVERSDGLVGETVATGLGGVDAEGGDERCLVAPGILARRFAEGGAVRLDVENVVGDLECRAECFAVARYRLSGGRVGTPNRAPAMTA